MKSDKKQHLCDACPIASVADLLGDMWTILIVRDLVTGPKRFSSLTTSLDGVSTRTLTLKLGKLCEVGIIEKKTYKEKPPRVEYSLTKKGKELDVVLKAMRKFGERL